VQCLPPAQQFSTGRAAGSLPSSAYVDGQSICLNRTGDRVCVDVEPFHFGPYKSVAEGARGVRPGGVLSIKGGSYREAVFLNRTMEIRAEPGTGTVTINPPSLAPFDLVADTLDDNGLPLNPKWGGQLISGFPPDPHQCPNRDDFRCCLPFHCSDPFSYRDPGAFPCSNQFTYKTYGFSFPCPLLSPVCGPHINWFAATYDTTFEIREEYLQGELNWDQHSCPGDDDDDYSLNLFRVDQVGYAATRDNIHIEFDSGETVDRFTTNCEPTCSQWWRDFKQAVDMDDQATGCGYSGILARGFIRNSWAIVTGLMGFDIEHDVHVELHPVWALAINTTNNYSDWAFFARNWGNEGFCGRGQQFAYFKNNQYTFRLPWKPGATDVHVLSQTWHPYNTQQPGPVVTGVPGKGVFVTFFLDPPTDRGSMWDGELHLSWTP
jgi:hypothetical protein